MENRVQKALAATAIASMIVFTLAMRCNREETGARHGSPKSAAPALVRYPVDGDRALGHIEKIVSFGPRHPGTPGAEKTRLYIVETLGQLGLSPARHDFTARTPHPDHKRVSMANISVDIPGAGPKAVLLGGHFDGKIIEAGVFRGANDGGSSTGLLLEMARVLVETPPPCPVQIVFFDGEEAFVKWSDADSLYGSKQMAAEIKQKNLTDRFAAAVVVDMIGDRRLRLTRELGSTTKVFALLEKTARELGHGDLFTGPSRRIEDDHTPLMQIGIPAAVLIDLNYGPGWVSNAYWHTPADTIDKLSKESLEAVGQVVLGSLAELSALTR
jgi:glutaminyl-peptide cyclotransferase